MLCPLERDSIGGRFVIRGGWRKITNAVANEDTRGTVAAIFMTTGNKSQAEEDTGNVGGGINFAAYTLKQRSITDEAQ